MRRRCAGSGAAQGHPDFSRQYRTQFRPDEPPDPDRPPLTGQLDQRPSVRPRLHPHPFPTELRPLQLSAVIKLDHELRSSQINAFPIPCMPGVDQERNTDSNQLCPSKRQHEGCPLKPERCANTQRHHAQRQIHPAKLDRRDRTVTLQKPLDVLALNRSEAKYQVCHAFCLGNAAPKSFDVT